MIVAASKSTDGSNLLITALAPVSDKIFEHLHYDHHANGAASLTEPQLIDLASMSSGSVPVSNAIAPLVLGSQSK